MAMNRKADNVVYDELTHTQKSKVSDLNTIKINSQHKACSFHHLFILFPYFQIISYFMYFWFSQNVCVRTTH